MMLWLFVCVAVLIAGYSESREMCALYGTPKDDVYVSEEPLFLELGRQDVLEEFSVEMEVMAPPDEFNGNLFAVGNKRDFPYYERQWAAVSTQFLIVEIFFASVTLTVKSLGTYNTHSIELSWANPPTYDLGDGNWHSVRAWRSPCCWHLSLDEKETSETIRAAEATDKLPLDSTNVWLEGGHAFLGGRPGYSAYQFMGAIKNLRVNNRPIRLQQMEAQNGVRVARCESPAFTTFMRRVTAMTASAEALASFYDLQGEREHDANYDSESSFFDYEQKKQTNPKWSMPIPGIGRR